MSLTEKKAALQAVQGPGSESSFPCRRESDCLPPTCRRSASLVRIEKGLSRRQCVPEVGGQLGKCRYLGKATLFPLQCAPAHRSSDRTCGKSRRFERRQ